MSAIGDVKEKPEVNFGMVQEKSLVNGCVFVYKFRTLSPKGIALLCMKGELGPIFLMKFLQGFAKSSLKLPYYSTDH